MRPGNQHLSYLTGLRAKGLVGALAIACTAATGSALAACDKGPGTSAKTLERQGDQPLVVYVDAPGEETVDFSDEAEPNNELKDASSLVPGTGVRGTLDGETDRDLYNVEIERDGHVRIQVGGIESVDLILELLDAKGEVLAISDRGPAQVTEGMPNIHVTAGRYYVAVREFVKERKKRGRQKKKKKGEEEPEPAGRQGLSPVYELVLVPLPDPLPPRNEVEPNENRELANEMLLGDEVLGFMGWARDVDVWRLSLEGFASHYGLNIELDGVPGVTLQLTVFDERGEEVLSRRSDKDGGLSVENLVVVADETDSDLDDPSELDEPARAPPPNPGGPGFYYAQISARRSNPLEPYRLRMRTRLLEPDQEIEPNDRPEQAMLIADTGGGSDTMRRGFLSHGDVDHYTIEPSAEPYALAVTCAPISDIDVVLEVKVDGKTLAQSDEYKRSGKESLVDMRIEAGQRVLLAISGKGALDDEARYELGISTYALASAPSPSPGGAEGLLDEYGDEPE